MAPFFKLHNRSLSGCSARRHRRSWKGGSGVPGRLSWTSKASRTKSLERFFYLGLGFREAEQSPFPTNSGPIPHPPAPPLLSCPSTPASSCQTRPVGFSVQTMRMWCVPLQQEALIWSLSPKLYHPPALASRWPSRNFRLSQIGAHGRQHLGEGVPDSVIN